MPSVHDAADAAIVRVAADPTRAKPADLAIVQGAASQAGERGNRATAALQGNPSPYKGRSGIFGD